MSILHFQDKQKTVIMFLHEKLKTQIYLLLFSHKKNSEQLSLLKLFAVSL